MIDNSTGPDVQEADGTDSEAVNWRDALPAAEFCFWVIVLLAPMLRLINGAAVTDDQFYVQAGLVTLPLAGAVMLRIVNWGWAR